MKSAIEKGFVGTFTPVLGVVVSISTMEDWLRIFSLLVGLLVAILSVISISLSIRRKWRQYKLEKSDKASGSMEQETTTL